jgi:hypothetical protein
MGASANRLAWFGLVIDLAVLGAVYFAYSAVRLFVEGDYADAVGNSVHLIRIERAIGLYHEVTVQNAVAAQPWLAALAEYTYRFVYFPFMVLATLLVMLRDRTLYRAYRNAIFLSLLIGLICFALLPVAPPRLLPEYGFFDPIHDGRIVLGSRNDFAAVPSFHFGFMLLGAIGVSHAWGWRPWMCAALAVIPVMMLFAIVATANHFFLDAAIGGAVVMFSWWIFVYHRPRDGHAQVAGRRHAAELVDRETAGVTAGNT